MPRHETTYMGIQFQFNLQPRPIDGLQGCAWSPRECQRLLNKDVQEGSHSRRADSGRMPCKIKAMAAGRVPGWLLVAGFEAVRASMDGRVLCCSQGSFAEGRQHSPSCRCLAPGRLRKSVQLLVFHNPVTLTLPTRPKKFVACLLHGQP